MKGHGAVLINRKRGRLKFMKMHLSKAINWMHFESLTAVYTPLMFGTLLLSTLGFASTVK